MTSTVKDFYNAYGRSEVERLSSVYCTFEYQNNLKLMKKYFPSTGRILDIGAGPGQYSLPLLKAGYHVTLFDVSETLLSIASEEFEKENVLADNIICDDARNLKRIPDNYFDAVLLMGPMYHILDETERDLVLKDVNRIVKPDGIALIEFINAWGVVKAGLHEFPAEYDDLEKLNRYLTSFCIDTLKEPLSNFTDVYLSTPPDAANSIINSGFNIISYAGTESFASGMHSDITTIYRNLPDAFNNIVDFAFTVCELHPFRDLTEHLSFIVKKPFSSNT